ncbi:MAG TPA: hypothetical protein PLZ10_02060 [Chitinophagaceae bacterium]|nr:hypothetical protein [Chitinophagaceae bacterium]
MQVTGNATIHPGMPLDIHKIQPQKGEFSCNLWENAHIGLPLTLFYSIEIPILPFDTGQNYVDQPASTSIMMEWLKFANPITESNEKNWKNLTGKEFEITYEDGTGEGSIYLGNEHCQFNSRIKFLDLQDTTFDILLTLHVAFNIDTINLPENGEFIIATQVEFKGLLLYDNQSLPTVALTQNEIELISGFIDITTYQSQLTNYNNPHVHWRQLKPRP